MNWDEFGKDNEESIDDAGDNLIHVDFEFKDKKEEFDDDEFEEFYPDHLTERRNHTLIRYLEESRKSNEIITLSAFVSIVLATIIFIMLSVLLILITLA